MKRKRIGIGIDNFEEIIEENYYYVDKTALIKKILDVRSKVTLFTRPRRFGKSLNLSMLKYYFEKSEKDSTDLFEGLCIATAGEEYARHQGKYPVIMLNFKEGKQDTFESSYDSLKRNIAYEYRRHEKILGSGLLAEYEVECFQKIVKKTGGLDDYRESVAFLCRCLEKVYREKAIILIDEYDVPLENAYYKGFYEEMISFIRGILSVALKTNDSLAFAVLTGCLRITKESIFTGLNNLNIISIQTPGYGEFFGFTPKEVEEMLQYFGKESHMETIREWYNGYLFGNEQVYNPWSVIKYVSTALEDDEYLPQPYWSNTSSNSIIKDLIERADWETKAELERLVQGESIEKPIHEDITFADIYKDNNNLWNFLYFTGYLKKVKQRIDEEQVVLTLEIPNLEVKSVYRRQIMEWVKEQVEKKDMTKLYEATLSGDLQGMEEAINQTLMETISYYEYNEAYYHGFIGGLYKGMEYYFVKSNVECGLGRPDLLITYATPEGKAIIFEFKITKEYSKLEEKAVEALQQIEEKKYVEGMQARGYTDILVYGVAFFEKTCVVKKGDC